MWCQGVGSDRIHDQRLNITLSPEGLRGVYYVYICSGKN